MYIRRIKAITKKEINHILRDPFTLIMAIIIPVFLIIMFGYAIDLDVKNVKLAVYDQDNTQASRMLSQTFTNSKYFKMVSAKWDINPEESLSNESAKAALVIPKEFEENITTGRTATAQILLDGSDSSIVGTILFYLNGILDSATYKLAPTRSPQRIKIIPRYLFNPEQNSSWFIVPGLSVVILAILAILLTALTVAREWETGSMELLLSTPLKPFEIVIGKAIPYLILGLIGATLVYLAARLLFEIPFTGSHINFIIGTVLFLCTYLFLGLFISAVSKNQQLAMQIALVAGYLPSLLLSGFIFSIENMPPFWQKLTTIFPARWYMVICRSSYLKNPDFMDLLPQYIPLIIIATILMFLVTKRFTGRIE